MPDDTKANSVEINEPVEEEEKPFPGAGEDSTKADSHSQSEDISPKENKAYHLVWACIIAIALLMVADYVHMWCTGKEASFVSSILEIFKYVLTTALGYFFATNRKHN